MRGESGAAGTRGRGTVGFATRFLRTLRQFAGMPDYERHVEHLRRCHPERPVPTERQFYDEYLQARYSDGPTRCC
jgi:uncharacterized short protein YbdD (DUF466 family)